MPKPKILAFAGSTRVESFNKKLVRVAAQAARDAGADVTLIDLRDFPLPLYDGDLEEAEGLPANVKRLKEIFTAHDGLMISSPEYNSSISAVLKNTIDWVTRPMEGEPPLGPFLDKVGVLMGASPGNLGGLRSLSQLRWILGNIQVMLLPDQFALMKSHEAFHPDGTLKDAKQQQTVAALGTKLAKILIKLRA